MSTAAHSEPPTRAAPARPLSNSPPPRAALAVPAMTLVPIITLLFGYFPIALNLPTVLAITVYYIALHALTYYCKSRRASSARSGSPTSAPPSCSGRTRRPRCRRRSSSSWARDSRSKRPARVRACARHNCTARSPGCAQHAESEIFDALAPAPQDCCSRQLLRVHPA